MVEELMHQRDRTPEEDELYELLIVLIEKFEQEYYAPAATAMPRSILLFLMEQRELQPGDLVELWDLKKECMKWLMAIEVLVRSWH